MTVPAGNSDLLTSLGVAAVSVVGAIANSGGGSKWQDPKTGKFSPFLMIGGISTCLILATAIRGGGQHYGVEPWLQVATTGVLCYVGADPIIRGLAQFILKRIGANPDGSQSPSPKP